MDPLVYTTKFTVKGHDVNSNKYLTIPALLRSMQEASLKHARQLKTSVWDMTEEKLTWVLVRKEIKIITPLTLDGTYTIITYPSGFDKFLAYRDYLVFDSNKKLVVGASSTWTLLQTDTRKLMKIPSKILEIGVPDKTRFLPQPEKSIAMTGDFEKMDTREVRHYDLDWNNHINNIVLIRYIMEALKKIGVEDEHVSKLLVHFKNELNLGEKADVYQLRIGDSYYSNLKESSSGKDVAIGQITLNKD